MRDLEGFGGGHAGHGRHGVSGEMHWGIQSKGLDANMYYSFSVFLSVGKRGSCSSSRFVGEDYAPIVITVIGLDG